MLLMNVIRIRAGALVVIALALLAACTATPSATPGGSPSAAPQETPTASASASASPSPEESAVALPQLVWQRLEVPALGENSAVIDVVAGGPGFVALASDGPQGSTILTSTDGREWTEVPQPGWQNAGLVDLAAANGRLVAVGRDTTDVDVDLAIAWISDDGVEWRQAEGGPDLEGAQLIEAIATEDGFMAAGGYPRRDAGGVWTSPDGELWTRSATPEAFERGFTWAVAEGGPGFVAVGWQRNDDPAVGFDPAFWTSADGVEWTLAATPDGAGTQVRNALALDDGSLVAVGELMQGGQSFAWVSDDGTSWDLIGPDSFEGALVQDLVAVPGGLIAVGGRNVDDGGVWLSTDGREWAVVDDASLVDAYLIEAIAVGADVIAVGALQEQIEGTESYGYAPMIWYASAD